MTRELKFRFTEFLVPSTCAPIVPGKVGDQSVVVVTGTENGDSLLLAVEAWSKKNHIPRGVLID